MTDIQKRLTSILKKTLFSKANFFSIKEETESDRELLEEAKQQAVYCFVASDESDEASQCIAQNMQVAYENAEIDKEFEKRHIPYVTLKGFAAAVYYPNPWYRIAGDIDLYVPESFFAEAYHTLSDMGYQPACPLDGDDREIPFFKDKYVVELHRRFASLNSKQQERLLDTWIEKAIPKAYKENIEGDTFSVLPSIENGLVILSHISQHIENGLGLRQIIDWLMFTRCQLHDDAWPAFKQKTDELGLTKLARTITRLGQLYLGLTEEHITWCQVADDAVCEELLDYLFECGNFGMKLGISNTVTMVLSHGKGVTGFFRNLQKRGESNWAAYKKHHWLKPFCWAFQGFRYIKKVIQSKQSLSLLREETISSRKRYQLMEAIGATQVAKKDISR